MHYTVKEDLIEQVAKRMNPEKYSWSEKGKVELRSEARSLLEFIEGFQRAAELQEKAGKEYFQTVGRPRVVVNSPVTVPLSGSQTGPLTGALQINTQGRTAIGETGLTRANQNAD